MIRGDIRITARIERHADGTRIREYSVGEMTYGSIEALQTALEGR